MGEPEIRIVPEAAKKLSELITNKYMSICSLADFTVRNLHYIAIVLEKENFEKLNMDEKEKLMQAFHFTTATAMFYCKKYKFEEGTK